MFIKKNENPTPKLKPVPFGKKVLTEKQKEAIKKSIEELRKQQEK